MYEYKIILSGKYFKYIFCKLNLFQKKKTVIIIMRGASVCLLVFTLVSVCAAVDILNVEAVCRTHKHGDVHLKQSALKVYGRVDFYNMTSYFNTTGGHIFLLTVNARFENLVKVAFYTSGFQTFLNLCTVGH